jgi:hypothetical protein
LGENRLETANQAVNYYNVENKHSAPRSSKTVFCKKIFEHRVGSDNEAETIGNEAKSDAGWVEE